MTLVYLVGARAPGQTCTVSTTGISFGTFQPLAGVPGTSTATVTVICNSLTALLVSYTIQLSPGSTGSYATRSMSGSGGRLGYQLYTSSLYNQVWGDGTAGTIGVTDSYHLGASLPTGINYTVYGAITASANVGVGIYSDTVTVLVAY